MLFSAALVTGAEAAATKTPTPVPLPTWTPAAGSTQVTLKADGKGDYPDLSAALADIDEGDTIHLEKAYIK